MTKALANKKFLFLWLSQVFTQLGANLLSFVLALRVFEMTNSNTAVGILMLVFGFPSFLFSTTAGVIIDRFNKFKILFLVNSTLIFLVSIFYFSSQTIFLTFIFLFSFSFPLQFFFPSLTALIPTVVKEGELLEANSLYTLTLYITVISGFVGAGPLLRIIGHQNTFILISMLFGSSLVLVNRIDNMTVSGFLKIFLSLKNFNPFLSLGGIIMVVLKGVKDTIQLIKSNSKIRISMMTLVFSQMMITILLSLSPGFAVNTLKVDVSGSSVYVILPAALGMIIGSLSLGYIAKKYSKSIIRKLGLFGIFLSLLVLSLVTISDFMSLFLVFIALILFGTFNTLIEIPSTTIIQEEAKEFRGRVYGLLGSFVFSASTIPLLVTGVAADTFGVGRVILGMSVLTLIFLVASIFRL